MSFSLGEPCNACIYAAKTYNSLASTTHELSPCRGEWILRVKRVKDERGWKRRYLKHGFSNKDMRIIKIVLFSHQSLNSACWQLPRQGKALMCNYYGRLFYKKCGYRSIIAHFYLVAIGAIVVKSNYEHSSSGKACDLLWVLPFSTKPKKTLKRKN